MIATIELGWRFGTIELPAADRYIRAAIELTGEFSGLESDLYRALLRPGDVALDVGANVGVFAIAMGLAVGPSGRVLAFEPQPPIFEILGRNLARHRLQHVEAHRAIVADSPGEGGFADIRALPEGHLVNFGGISLSSGVDPRVGSIVPTPVVTIDSFGLQRCRLIKLDVEGSEEAALAGADVTIARCRPILSIECDRPGGTAPWVDGLLAADYRIWRFRGSNLRSPNPKRADISGQANFSVLMALAVPAEHAAAVPRLPARILQPIGSREDLERLSLRIEMHRPDDGPASEEP